MTYHSAARVCQRRTAGSRTTLLASSLPWCMLVQSLQAWRMLRWCTFAFAFSRRSHPSCWYLFVGTMRGCARTPARTHGRVLHLLGVLYTLPRSLRKRPLTSAPMKAYAAMAPALPPPEPGAKPHFFRSKYSSVAGLPRPHLAGFAAISNLTGVKLGVYWVCPLLRSSLFWSMCCMLKGYVVRSTTHWSDGACSLCSV